MEEYHTQNIASTAATIAVQQPDGVAVGIYDSVSSSGKTTGYSVNFDDQGKGLLYTATGDVYEGTLTFQAPQEVKTGAINLTVDAVPVSMMKTWYFLDKARI
ncbi:hypothetical protein BGZ97_006363 [Linnemannia gamsii]|uniref:Uncharacterized protein n=1 Tax=Linnemannia gamsii TaxID=64522 RepID=A0A9P6RBY0_9FUNG|nr:hypothetical protein BGZ97_006363 [Linnemannia gamsii]